MAGGDYIVYALTGADETVALETGAELGGSKVTLDNEVYADSGFSTASGTITVSNAGTYFVIAHMAADRDASATGRSSIETKVHINGSLVSGCFTDGFIRRTSSADECSDCAFGLYELSASDTIELYKQRINLAGPDARLVGSTTTYNTSKTSLTVIEMNSDRDLLVLEATSTSDINPQTENSAIDVPWDVNTRVDSGSFTHSTTVNPAEITLAAGRYLVTYSDTYSRDTDTSIRTGVYARLQLDGADIPGSQSNSYMRGSQSGESILRGNLSCATIFDATASQVLKLVVAAEGSGVSIAKTRLTDVARLCVYRMDGSESSWKAVSTSTQSIGATATTTVIYDSSAAPGWVDAAYTLSGNLVRVPISSKFLCLHSVMADDGATNRCAPWQHFWVDSSIDNLYGSGNRYARNNGGMEMVAPTIGAVVSSTVGPVTNIGVRNASRATGGSIDRVASTGGFCGLDLSTIGTGTPPAPAPAVDSYIFVA